MPVNLVSNEELRSALLPYRADPGAFEAGVRMRLAAAEKERAADPLASWSPFLRAAAAFLPLELLTGCKALPATAALARTGGAYKVISYLAYPAISMFVLLGATIFSVFKIRGIRNQEVPGVSQQEAMYTALGLRMRHMVGAMIVFATTFYLTWIGAAWLVFAVYIVSFGLLLYVLNSLAKHGLANRTEISQFCTQGLLFIGIASGSLGHSDQGIHFVNQRLIWLVFMVGVFILIFIGLANLPLPHGGQRGTRHFRGWMIFAMILAMSPLLFTMPGLFSRGLNPIVWPATPDQIKGYVESFSEAPHSSASWQNWEILAQWAIDARLDPDMTKPRKLLAEELAGEQNPFVLGTAIRVGLLPADQTDELKKYPSQRRLLFPPDPLGRGPQAILSVEVYDWVIRTAVLRNDLSEVERDVLEQRLLATLARMSEDQHATLRAVLRVTQLLQAIERPIDRDQYRSQIHDLLRKCHDPQGNRFWPAGGFKTFQSVSTGTVEPTAYAVELMEIYGVPNDIDLNLVRSCLRRQAVNRVTGWHWMASAALQRLEGLPEANLSHLTNEPGAKRPTWLEILYYERTLLAAMVLVGLCIFATVSAPKARETPKGYPGFGVQGSGEAKETEGRGASGT